MLSIARLRPVSSKAAAPLRVIKSYYAKRRYDGFKRHVAVDIDAGRYLVKTVESAEEYMAVLKLRRKVFHKEYAGKVFSLRSDRDKFDSEADFLAVIDKNSGEVVGTYRLISSEFSNHFYSATEFMLDDFLAQPGRKLELSRACISRDHRQGIVIALLWKGLAAYMQAMNADYFFGLSSVKTMVDHELFAIYRKLEQMGAVFRGFEICPQPSHRMQLFQHMLEGDLYVPHSDDAEIPSLLRAYIKAGAKVVAEPAIDRKFRCADFLTVMRISDLTTAYERKYTRS